MMDTPRLFNSAEIRRFLVAKGANGACSACANREFDILDEELIGGRVGFPVLKRSGDDTVSAGLFEVIVLACTKCGSLRTYERGVVAEWISANPAKKMSSGASAARRA